MAAPPGSRSRSCSGSGSPGLPRTLPGPGSAHQVRTGQVGQQPALVDRLGVERALFRIMVAHIRDAEQRADFAEIGLPAVGDHAADVRIGTLGLRVVGGAAIDHGGEALEVERTVGAHVDHAGNAAFGQIGRLRFIHVHALQHGRRNVRQLDVAAGGGEQFAAVQQRGDARQAADQHGIGFAAVTAHLHAGDARQRLGHVGVRELADVVSDDGIDNVIGILLDFLRALRRPAHASHGHGGFRRWLYAVGRGFLCYNWEGAQQARRGQDGDAGFEDETMLCLGHGGPGYGMSAA
ncbi:conserved hypothetical protein [Ricinus communis]|uniref:Uncharacterized protein n=1 Tax=Ricinus communis TaxID=3988 RepID=B9TLK0_RICCO|nr:conserved hypothetical protein [Ricinus communis]